MIIDRLVLHNVGVFNGRNEIVLTPAAPDKPVVLIGGQNGGGKTTLLDALQLAFYGSQAKCAGRGKSAYKEYLRDLIHAGVPHVEGASVQVHFRRTVDGQTRALVVTRSWRDRAKGVEEFLRVDCDGQHDPVLSDHWVEYIENYLPARLASLFFFDGEQIASMAEDESAAGMLETALQSLLGLDLIERLKVDLTVIERRKKEAAAPEEIRQQLDSLDQEVREAEAAVERAAQEQARLNSLLTQMRVKELADLKQKFSKEGGELFLQREQLVGERAAAQTEVTGIEHDLREIAAGPGPLLLVEDLLCETEKQAKRELEQQRNQLLAEAEVDRDRQIVAFLRKQKLASDALSTVASALERHRHHGTAEAAFYVLNPPPELPEELRRIREVTLPPTRERVRALLARLRHARERLAQLDTLLASVPAADAVGILQGQIQKTEQRIRDTELDLRRAVEVRHERESALTLKQRSWRLLFEQVAATRENAEDDGRIMERIPCVQTTLDAFRARIVARHLGNFERLILESFQCLLHKTNLVTRLTIDPNDFRISLTGAKGQSLAFQRLSAGERQLLAASILWGIAKASGRPVPTFIDTPLGRLDSSHRRHLVERYFPAASHQVVLLSTDEEIVGQYFALLKKTVGRKYLLTHDGQNNCTTIQEQYFTS